jgi:hypothetical protein
MEGLQSLERGTHTNYLTNTPTRNGCRTFHLRERNLEVLLPLFKRVRRQFGMKPRRRIEEETKTALA